jgi:quinol monooxygenase YgiN
MYSRVIRYRWLPGHASEGPRLVQALLATAAGQPDLLAARVLRALGNSHEGIVVFDWASRAALERHRAATPLETVAPWAIPLLHWRTDQCYEHETPLAASGAR